MNRKNRAWLREGIFFTALFMVALLISYPINFPDGEPKGGSEFFADKAAYYVYLPASFIYKWDVKKFPEKIDEKTRGFTLHYANNRVIIKTTYGVALMLTPFFLPTHLIAKVFHLQPDGFSVFYQGMMTIPGIFYVVLALYFLRRFLSYYYSKRVAYSAVVFLFFGTNLFFYSVDEGLMSHVYSFFLFSVSLYLLKRFQEGGMQSFRTFIWLSLLLSIAILIRPTNILFLSVLAFLDVRSWKEAGSRILFYLKPRYAGTFLAILFLVLMPQFVYWKYLSGKFLYNSYPGEGFVNLLQPMIPEVWMAPLNGLFLYTPLALFFLFGMVMMVVKRVPNGLFLGAFFLLISYLFASWLTWFFGGSFGMRPFVEYYALFALPFGFSLEWILQRKNLLVQSLWISLLVAFSWYNAKLTKHFNCFPGSIWSWDDYEIYLSDACIQRFDCNTYTYINDFENNTLPDEVPRVFSPVHSKTLSSYLDESMEFGCKYTRRFDQIMDKNPDEATFSLFYCQDKGVTCNALFVCSVEDTLGRLLYYKAFPFMEGEEGKRGRGEEGKSKMENGKWKSEERNAKSEERNAKSNWLSSSGTVYFPEWIPPYARVSFYIWNVKRSKFFIDDIVIKFR